MKITIEEAIRLNILDDILEFVGYGYYVSEEKNDDYTEIELPADEFIKIINRYI